MSPRIETHREWLDDPLVWVASFAAIATHAWMIFAGPYLPYIDWSNHLGLISILANGGETGALAYADRSFLPTPYWLFYMVTAAWAQIVSVTAAAKLTFLMATGLMTFGAAYLATATGRSARIGLFAPLAMFGYPFGYGFASFVCAMPLALFTFGAAERALRTPTPRRLAVLAATLALTYLGHALVFGFVVLLLGVRITVHLVALAIDRKLDWRRPAGLVAAAVPTVLLAMPALATLTPWMEEGGRTTGEWMTFAGRTHSLAKLGQHLLERGSADHWLTMKLTLLFVVALAVFSIFRGLKGRAGWGLEIYAACAAALYLWGPVTLERPMQVWMIYPRYATFAALLLFMLPKADLRGWLGGAVASLALGLVLYNASINRNTIVVFNRAAAYYDPVRTLIPRGSRVLALTIPKVGDLSKVHPSMNSLFFYHLVDGAAYTAFLFDTPMHPVRPKKRGRPRAPFWRKINLFNPHEHGVDFDYLVIRGDGLVRRVKGAGLHELVRDVAGWHVFRTKNPTPKR